ncbi:MAG: hypothetical protein AB8H79_17955 [Myxococcota bacterium]
MSDKTKASSYWDYVPSTVDLVELANSTAESAAETLRSAVGTVADAGNGAVQEALNLGQAAGNAALEGGQAAVQGGKAAVESGLETGSDIFDAIATAIVGDETQAVEGETKSEVDLPGKEEAAPAEEAIEDAVEHADDPTYKDQRDNESAHVGGDASCSPTSFAAALIDSVGDETAVRTRAIELINERGGKSDYAQTEELIIELLQVIDWSAACSASPAFFWNGKDWATWAKRTYGGAYYKDPYAQQFCASLFSGMSSEGGEIYGEIYDAADWGPVFDALDQGANVTAEGGKMTGSGHVIRVLEADESGLLINDPYGLWVHAGFYIRNGADNLPDAGGDWPTFERRTGRNTDLREQWFDYEEQGENWTPYAQWGEKNWYSWADASEAGIGKWVSVLATA